MADTDFVRASRAILANIQEGGILALGIALDDCAPSWSGGHLLSGFRFLASA
jgi:hypothetical protein